MAETGGIVDTVTLEEVSEPDAESSEETVAYLIPYDKNTYSNIAYGTSIKYFNLRYQDTAPIRTYRIVSISEVEKNRRRWFRVLGRG